MDDITIETNKMKWREVALDPMFNLECYLDSQEKRIERLNNIINEVNKQLNYLETYSSKEDVFEDMKRRLESIEKIINKKR